MSMNKNYDFLYGFAVQQFLIILDLNIVVEPFSKFQSHYFNDNWIIES